MAWRGHGLSKLLVEECENYAKNKTETNVKTQFVLETSEVQFISIKLYQKIGYKVIEKYSIGFLLGLTNIIMLVFSKTK